MVTVSFMPEVIIMPCVTTLCELNKVKVNKNKINKKIFFSETNKKLTYKNQFYFCWESFDVLILIII